MKQTINSCTPVVKRYWKLSLLIGIGIGLSVTFAEEFARNKIFEQQQRVNFAAIANTTGPRMLVDLKMVVRSVNLPAVRLLEGESISAMTGISGERFIPPSMLAGHRERFDVSHWEEGVTHIIECDVQTLAGNTFPGRITLTAIESDGRSYYVVAMEDLSQEIASQEAVAQEVYERVMTRIETQ